MTDQLKITGISPKYAIPGGIVSLKCEGFRFENVETDGVFVGGQPARITASSSSQIIFAVPDDVAGDAVAVQIVSGGARSNVRPINIGRLLTAGMHIVANPAIDPSDDAIILTRSGTRGQQLPTTLFRLESDGYLDEMPEAVMNPTGIAFDKNDRMFVTNRAQGEVYLVGSDGIATVYATGMGIASGIAFDADGVMFVGDRSGTIYRISDFAEVDTFTIMEASVAAFHLAFGPDERLYMTSPGLASHDAVYAIDRGGNDSNFFRGLGRPQGLAFDSEGELYVAACYKGLHGIVHIKSDGSSAEHFVAGNNVVGLCFTRKGEMVVATNDSIYAIECDLYGTLLK